MLHLAFYSSIQVSWLNIVINIIQNVLAFSTVWKTWMPQFLNVMWAVCMCVCACVCVHVCVCMCFQLRPVSYRSRSASDVGLASRSPGPSCIAGCSSSCREISEVQARAETHRC